MKAAIFGAGNAGRFLIDEIIEKSQNIQIVGTIDNKIEGEYRKIRVSKPGAFFAEAGNLLFEVVF